MADSGKESRPCKPEHGSCQIEIANDPDGPQDCGVSGAEPQTLNYDEAPLLSNETVRDENESSCSLSRYEAQKRKRFSGPARPRNK